MEEFKRQILDRAVAISTALVAIAGLMGRTAFMLGLIAGFVSAFFNFRFMSTAVEKATKREPRKAKNYLWINSAVRFSVIALVLVFFFNRNAALGIGASVGLLSIVLSVTSSILVPFKSISKEGGQV